MHPAANVIRAPPPDRWRRPIRLSGLLGAGTGLWEATTHHKGSCHAKEAAAIQSQPIVIGTHQRVLELHAVKDFGTGLHVYVKDGTHREVCAAALEPLLLLCMRATDLQPVL